jgi:hypothetical protein
VVHPLQRLVFASGLGNPLQVHHDASLGHKRSAGFDFTSLKQKKSAISVFVGLERLADRLDAFAAIKSPNEVPAESGSSSFHKNQPWDDNMGLPA